jgi:hypothetical protein
MRIAFYIDPNISSVATFYTKVLLKIAIEKLGMSVNMHIPSFNHINDNKPIDPIYPYFNQKWNEILQYPIIWDVPDVNKYDALLVTHQRNSKWKGIPGLDFRAEIAKKFLNANKKVIAIKDELSFEFSGFDKRVLYCNYSTTKLNIKESLILPDKATVFITPALCNLSFIRPNALSKAEFFNLYKLDNSKKLITCFMPKHKKIFYLKQQNSPFLKNFIYLLSNLDKITNILANLDYQIIFKSHRGDWDILAKEYQHLNSSKIQMISPLHTHEAIKYSNFALTTMSNIVYELYLQNLPCIEIGSGLYYPAWWTKTPMKCNPARFPITTHTSSDLIYGQVLTEDEWINKTEKTLKNIFAKNWDINSFKYKDNNPIYGNSYNGTIDQIAKIVVNKLN